MFHPNPSFSVEYGRTPPCRFHVCFVPNVFILMFSPCDVFHMLLCSASCASSVDASGCQRHNSTKPSCPRRSSHTRSVRGSCPRRQRSILLEAQCKQNPFPGPPSPARLSIGAPSRACVQTVNRVSTVLVVCAGMGSAGHSQQDHS